MSTENIAYTTLAVLRADKKTYVGCVVTELNDISRSLAVSHILKTSNYLQSPTRV